MMSVDGVVVPRAFPSGYDTWIVKAVTQINNRVWDFSGGRVDLGAAGGSDLQEIAEIIRSASVGVVGVAPTDVVPVEQLPGAVSRRVLSVVVTFG